jgi:AraC-like DNA-binding protein
MSSISVKVFQVIVAGAAAAGVEPAALLAAAGIEPGALADPDGRLPRAIEARMWREAVRLTGDEGFGLHLSERLPVEGFGALGFAVRSSATVGEAYARAIRYTRLMVHGPAIEMQIDGAVARIRHDPPPGEPLPSRHAVEFLMTNLVFIARHGADPAFMPRAARFRHAAPARADEHRRLLGAGVRFGQDRDELIIERAVLARPQVYAEPALSVVLDEHLSARLAALPQDGGLLSSARAAILADLAHGEPALSAVAARLSMSPRSLQRRLQEAASSLSALIDELRAELAVRYLRESRESIAEVAFLLGFSEVSTFHRAFKRWTGVTPAAYRRGRQMVKSAS